MRFLKRSIVGIFLMAVTLTLLAWAGMMVRGAVSERMAQEPRSFPQRERVFAVNVTTITQGQIAPELVVYGQIESRRSVDLRSPVGGTVMQTAPSLVEGGAVLAGDVLLTIDPAASTAMRDRIAADLSDAQAEVRDAERGIALARDDLLATRAQANLRKQALTRAQDLSQRGVGTAAAVETAELAASAADGAILTRRQAVAASEARVDQARTSLDRVQIDLAEAERALADTTVIAPFDGTASAVTISEGGRLTANEQFATLVDPNQLDVSFRVSTAQFARLLDGARLPSLPVTVSLDVDGADLSAQGTLTRAGGTVAEGQTGRVLFARLDAAPGLRPGDFVTVRVAEPALDQVAQVPATALGTDETVLVVNDDDRLESVQTRLLRRQGDNVIIVATDLDGRIIVTERSPLLGAGIGVRPILPEGAVAPMNETITLDDARREKLLTYVNDSRMPEEAKARIIAQLEQPEVPSAVITRLERRMGS